MEVIYKNLCGYHSSMNSNLKEKCTKGSNNLDYKLDKKQIKKPNQSRKVLLGFDNNSWKHMT